MSVQVKTTDTRVIVTKTEELHSVKITTGAGSNTKVTIANGLPIPFSSDSGSIVLFQAGQDLSSGRLVYIQDNKALYFDPNNSSLYGRQLGITKTAVLQNAVVKVQIVGIFKMSGLGLTPGAVYYAGVNGSLVTNVSGLTLIVPIGHAIDADQLSINFYSPIKTI